MEPPIALTTVAQDYLKVVWSAQEWSDDPVTTKLLAERLGVGPSTVSETVRRLDAQGLLAHARYGSVELTDAGRAHAVQIVRRHRLIETFLVETLGYRWDEVHDEAEVLEHAVSDLMVAKIDDLLGHPHRDPHGDPIPTADGQVRRVNASLLAHANAGAQGVIARISDADPDVLRQLAELGIDLDTVFEVVARDDDAGTRTVLWGSAAPCTHGPVELGLSAISSIWMTSGGTE